MLFKGMDPISTQASFPQSPGVCVCMKKKQNIDHTCFFKHGFNPLDINTKKLNQSKINGTTTFTETDSKPFGSSTSTQHLLPPTASNMVSSHN